ncbi:hypothetical protein HPB48_000141 [Haemaphysalis longicornis]|uniref:Uncharacterized protein n=1 Tax=Haemaphysalis longicornis TaxID=44386 RepID=A0A9J6H5V6_HAELO|nr:hypothetical protein HPB48_000141 [Haemaphysalis longicornis]
MSQYAPLRRASLRDKVRNIALTTERPNRILQRDCCRLEGKLPLLPRLRASRVTGARMPRLRGVEWLSGSVCAPG